MARLMRWNAVVLAGSRPSRDPFAEAHGTDLKALIPVTGEPMIRRPVAALLSCDSIAKVKVVTQQPARLAAVLPADPRLSVERSRGTIAETLLSICADPATEWPLIVTTADHALLDPGMVTDFCTRAGRSDVAVAVVEQRQLLRRLPNSRRTWIRFKGGAYSGANMFILRKPEVGEAIALWRSVEQDRKKGWKLLTLLGPGLFIRALLRRLTLEQTLSRVGRKLNMQIRAVELANPLAAIDVDKDSDLELVEQILAARA